MQPGQGIKADDQGGGEVLAFATRPTAPPSKDSVALLSGVISGGPLIRQTHPASSIELKAGSIFASLGMGNMLRSVPLLPKVSPVSPRLTPFPLQSPAQGKPILCEY